MSEKFRNVVCEPKDIIADIKRQILELISLNKTTCNNLPDLSIPNVLPDLSDLNPSQKVIDFLNDILALVTGINFDEMRMQLISWLVEQLTPLSENLSVNLINSIKSCFACKIDPKIPGWLFVTDPTTIVFDANGTPLPNSGSPGIGMNIELNKLDLTCLFAVDPNSEVGQLFYDGDETNDLNAFLWKVIQENGNPLIWADPINGKQIVEVRYFENSPTAFIESDGTVEYQNIEARPRVFNVRLINQTYQSKTLISFLNDYFNSQNPLFNVDKVVPDIINLIYGTLTNKIDLPDECLLRTVETEQAISDYIDNGIDNPEISLDDSFYEFNSKQITNIKQIAKQKKLGVKQYAKCCGKQTSSISYETVKSINDELTASSTLQEKINTYTRSLDALISESTEGVKNLDKNSASAEFLANFISSLQIALTKIVLTPKNLMMLNLFYYLVNSSPVKEVSVKKILKEYECIIRCIIAEILRKLIYDFLLPLVIKSLKNLILCVITKKIKEQSINYFKSKLSLLPGFVNENLEKINEIFGKGEDLVDLARGFTDKINLNSLNNTNLSFNKKGRFCD
jgi:hypothetical protein